MGMEQERRGGEWLHRRPGLLRLRVAGFGAHWCERTSTRPLQGDGMAVSMETGVCICRMASRLGSSRWLSPCIWQLQRMGNKDGQDRDTKERKRSKGYPAGEKLRHFTARRSHCVFECDFRSAAFSNSHTENLAEYTEG